MNKLISFRYPDWKNRSEFFVDWDTKAVTVIATFISDFRPAPEFGIGIAMRSPEDEFDLRVGVPLALKRALGKIVAVDRPALTKRFFRQWPEAHPKFHDTPEQEKRKELLTGIVARHRQRQFKETVETRFNAVMDAMREIEKTPEQHGRFKVNRARS